MLRICDCGQEFATKSSKNIYCGKECSAKFKQEKLSNKIEESYKFRCTRILKTASYRSRKLKVSFNLDLEYLINLWEEQDGCCSISGRVFDERKPSAYRQPWANAPSLDRIEPVKGYVKGNVRFVCYQVNTALHSFGEESLISLCKDILNFREGALV